MRRPWILIAAAPVAALVLYLALWPVGFDPVAWTPPPAPPLEGAFASNDALAATEVVEVGLGPEGTAVDSRGRIHAGLKDGRIVRLEEDGAVSTIASTGGRPLGMQFDAAGRLIVADAVRGLLAVTTAGGIAVLATEHDGLPFGFTDDLDIGADGTVYFTDASHRHGVHHFRRDALEHRPNGRLLAWHPRDRRTELLADGLYFANGVALAADEASVLVNETWEYRITRVWLDGPKKGTREPFATNLPGFPDNLTRGPSGTFWVALFAPRNEAIDALAGRPFVRKVVARLPEALQPEPARHAFVLGLDSAGNVVHNLQHDAPDSYAPITSVLEHDGRLFFGSLWREGIGRIPAP